PRKTESTVARATSMAGETGTARTAGRDDATLRMCPTSIDATDGPIDDFTRMFGVDLGKNSAAGDAAAGFVATFPPWAVRPPVAAGLVVFPSGSLDFDAAAAVAGELLAGCGASLVGEAVATPEPSLLLPLSLVPFPPE